MVSCTVCVLHKGTLLGAGGHGGWNLASAQLVEASALVGLYHRTRLIPVSKGRGHTGQQWSCAWERMFSIMLGFFVIRLKLYRGTCRPHAWGMYKVNNRKKKNVQEMDMTCKASGSLSGPGSLPPFFRPSAHKLHSGNVVAFLQWAPEAWVWFIPRSGAVRSPGEKPLVVLVWHIVPGERHCVCNRSFHSLFALNVKSVGPRGSRGSLGRFLRRSRIKTKGQVVHWVYWQEIKSDKNKKISSSEYLKSGGVVPLERVIAVLLWKDCSLGMGGKMSLSKSMYI